MELNNIIFSFVLLVLGYALNKYFLFLLKKIGYDTRKVEITSNKFNKLIEAYQRHYRQNIISGEIDYQTYKLINQQLLLSR